MPLRAMVNGNEVLSFDYDDQSWDALKRDKEKDIRLPCCGERGACRTSKLGTKHFYHLRRGECDFGGETPEHLCSKQTIVEAARSVGWSAMTEVPGDSWRADVLCTKGNARVAFEVQWSRQTAERTRERTSAYDNSGVRVCWLFRHMPEEFSYHPSREVPAFQLPDGPNGLQTLVAELLSGKWKFMQTRLHLPRRTSYTGIFILSYCYSCGGCFEYLAAVQSEDSHSWDDPRVPEYARKELHSFYQSQRLNRHPLARLRHEALNSNQICPHCGHVVMWNELSRQQKDNPWHRLFLDVKEDVSIGFPHWCNYARCTQHVDSEWVTAVQKQFKTKFQEWPVVKQKLPSL